MNIIITIPASIKWEDYQKELDVVKDGTHIINYKAPFLPRNVKIGDRCYIVHNKFIRGWMKIVGLVQGGFTCTTTGNRWEGNFIQRSGEFHSINPVPMQGFQGIRYTELNN